MKLNFQNNSEIKFSQNIFVKKAKAFEKIFKLEVPLELNLVLMNDKEIRQLNKVYRKKDKATDVLSFSYFQGKTAGEIFISMETASRQASEKKHTLSKELEILFVHGLLHVFGFDHKNDQEEAEMEKWAKKILNRR